MIQIFDIKKGKNNLKIDDNVLLKYYQDISNLKTNELFVNFKTKEQGLSKIEVHKRLKENGLNVVIKDDKKSWL